MAYIFRSPIWPDPRVKPPFGAAEIDWAHPLSSQLEVAFVANRGSGVATDLVRNLTSTITGNAPTWTTCAGGLSIKNAAGGGLFEFTVPSFASNAPFSLATRMTPGSVSTTQVAVGLGASLAGLGIRSNTQYLIQVAGVVAVSGGTPAIGKSADEVGVYDGTNLTLYVDGKSTAGPTAATWGGGTVVRLCADQNLSRVFLGNVEYGHVWRRTLSAVDALQLYAEPYGMLRPVVRRRWFVPPPPPPAAISSGATFFRPKLWRW